MSDDQTLYKVFFHFEEDIQSITRAVGPDDDETLAEYLDRHLNAKDAPKFAAFDDGAGGFTLINTHLLTKVRVRRLPDAPSARTA